ncbi:MAG: Endonuclease [Chlamydiota bacterium]|jgi:deoxyribonuclease-4
MQEPLLIGAHTSAQGGAHFALAEGLEIGATTIQLFTANQKRWQGKTIQEKEIEQFEEMLLMTGISHVMSHDSYLINLGSPNADTWHKSKKAFKEELERCHALKLSYLNFHPGAALDAPREQCLDRIIDSLIELKGLAANGPTRLLIETTAGQGSCVGWQFEEIGYLVERLEKHVPIGVCIDTCHIFAAGYDIRSKEGWDHTLHAFEKGVGLKHLYALHVNDSLKPLGSRKDRHAALGKGEIGIECFKVMMTHPHLKKIPKYLETPDGPPLWKKEIAMLREFAK